MPVWNFVIFGCNFYKKPFDIYTLCQYNLNSWMSSAPLDSRNLWHSLTVGRGEDFSYAYFAKNTFPLWLFCDILHMM